jgi:hypothetical protein
MARIACEGASVGGEIETFRRSSKLYAATDLHQNPADEFSLGRPTLLHHQGSLFGSAMMNDGRGGPSKKDNAPSAESHLVLIGLIANVDTKTLLSLTAERRDSN